MKSKAGKGSNECYDSESLRDKDISTGTTSCEDSDSSADREECVSQCCYCCC